MRPRSISDEIASKIRELRLQGYRSSRAICRALKASGVEISQRTLARFLSREDLAAERPPGLPEDPSKPAFGAESSDERFSPDAFVGDLRDRYLEACEIADALRLRASIGGPETRRYYEAVRLINEIAIRLVAAAPRPELAPEFDPANPEATARLVDRARAIAATLA